MTERRYGFRFSIIDAGLLIVSVVLLSAFVFLAGMYVGKGVEAHKAAQLAPPVRMPIHISEEPRPSATDTPLPWKLPKDKSVETMQPSTPGTAGDSGQVPTSSTQSAVASPPVNAAKKVLAKDTPPGERLDAIAGTPQPKTGTPSQLSLTKKSSLGEESVSSRTEAIPSRSNETLAEVKEAPSPTQKATRPTKGWKVQVEATSREENAQEIAKALRAQGYEPSVSKVTKQGEVWYRVRIGRFATQEEAVAAIARFRREGKFSQAYPVSE